MYLGNPSEYLKKNISFLISLVILGILIFMGEQITCRVRKSYFVLTVINCALCTALCNLDFFLLFFNTEDYSLKFLWIILDLVFNFVAK